MKNHLNTSLSELENNLFENAAVVLAIVNEDGEIVNLNKAGINKVEKEKSKVLNRKGGEVFNCVHAWTNDEVVCGESSSCASCSIRNTVMATFNSNETIYKKEGYLDVRIDQKVVRLSLLISTAIIVIDNKRHVLLTIDDITPLKNKEDQLEKLMATRAKFFSIITHDLINPLKSLSLLADTINREINNNDQGFIDTIGIMDQEIKRTSNIVDNLLIWSRAADGSVKANIESLDLGKLFEEIIDEFKPTAEKKSITVLNNLSNNISVRTDKELLTLIIKNLINNAIKFSDQKGIVSLNIKTYKDYIQIAVKDNGVGIPKKILGNIFDINKATITQGTEKETGIGLGLLLCKEFVDRLGGKISIKSKEGEGTTAFFSLPV